MTIVLDGKQVAKRIRASLKSEVAEYVAAKNRPPGLGVVLVGDNPASQAYVRSKEKAAEGCGFRTTQLSLPASSRFEDVSDALMTLNNDDRIDGILLQLPLPGHLDSERAIELILPSKDADGLHSMNQGCLMRGMEAGPRPCTPRGVMTLIDEAWSTLEVQTEVTLEGGASEAAFRDRAYLGGLHAVVVGRSNLVGKPVALMLLERHATVTIAHSRTANLPELVRSADIVVAACGKPQLVHGSWIKPGAVVIDVGINRLDDGTLVGDVHFESAAAVARAITPVPGGVGPMTVAMLLHNTMLLYRQRI